MMHRLFATLLFLFLAASSARAQSDPAPAGAPPALPFGSGEQSAPRYAGTSSPQNVLLFGLTQETAYDDNVLSNNLYRIGDTSFALGARLGFQQQRKRSSFAVDYQPDVLLYREVRGASVLNHGLQLDGSYQLGGHLGLRVRDSIHYRSGLFHLRSDEELMPGLGYPTTFNESVFVPLVRVFENNARVDLTYQKSARTAVDLFGGFLTRDFRGQTLAAQRLYDTQSLNGGAQYSYRLSRSTTVGGLYMLQNLRLGLTRSLVHSTFLNVVHQFSPRTRLELFGGPQYGRLQERFSIEFPLFPGFVLNGQVVRARWHGAFGGVFSAASENTAFKISAQRVVSDSGGLLASAVSNNEVTMNVRRRLARRWHATWALDLARINLLDSALWNGTIQTASSGIGLERSLSENVSAALRYNFMHQRSDAPAPLLTAIDRNRVSFGLSWQVRKIALGR